MADSRAMLYMVCYDISNPKRLGRVHRFLKKHGLPLQYSVFTVVLKRPRLLRLLESLSGLINDIEDDVRCYALPREMVSYSLGRQLFPEEVILFSQGVNKIIR